ncbi:MAG: hypothetical protein FWH22_09745, partial [Fibromonadales bacterium]|nr:hypothetical protein [Fibromonadales bacterium]
MGKSISEHNTQIEKLIELLSFFREKFGLPDIPVRQSLKNGLKYSFPRLPDFSVLNKLFTQENGLDFLYKSYKINKEIIKEFRKKLPRNIERLLSYLRYMKKQESSKHIYLTRTGRTKNNYIEKLVEFITELENSGIELKTLKYSARINEKLPDTSQMDEKTVER